MQVFLTGFMGAGKSTAGERAAAMLGWPFLDTDRLVAARVNMSIDEIFAVRGEQGFRRYESSALREAARLSQVLVATGGGAVLCSANRSLMQRKGIVIWLRADPDTLWLRSSGKTGRPLAARLGRDGFVQLLVERVPFYAQSHYVIDTSVLSVEETARQIAEIVRKAWPHASAPAVGGRKEPAGSERVIPVPAKPPYEVIAGPGLFRALPQWWGRWEKRPALEYSQTHRLAVVTTPLVWSLWGKELETGLAQAGYPSSPVVFLPEGEKAKTPGQLQRLWEAFTSFHLDRQSIVLAVGGGALTDVAGFAAATYMRGIAAVFLPTTLLGQVDAAVGGKTAIDYAGVKNLVGVFHQPAHVVADVHVLTSLPQTLYRSGLGEVAKYAIIAGDGFRQWLWVHRREVLARAEDTLVEVVARCLEIKASFVAADEHDTGLRQALNLGHTFGHAFEAAAGFRGPQHGLAVAAGIATAARLAQMLGLLDQDGVDGIIDLLRAFRLPTTVRPVDEDTILALMSHDKKSRGRLRLVLPTRAGVIERDDIEEGLIRRALKASCKGVQAKG